MKCLWCKTEIYELLELKKGFGKPVLIVQACDKDCGHALVVLQELREFWYPDEYPKQVIDEREEEETSADDINRAWAERAREVPVLLQNLFAEPKPLVLANLFN